MYSAKINKKIVFAVTTDLNYDQRMQRICTSLVQSGYELLLIGRKWPQSLPLLTQVYQQNRIHCYFNKGKLFYLEFTIRLFWYLLFQSADAYGAIDLDTALPVFMKAKLTGKPFIYDAHEYFPEVVEVINRPVIKKIWTSLEKFILARTKFAYTVNESLAQLFYERYRVKFSVIQNCTLLEPESALPVKSADKFLLYQGAVNEGRGLETLLRAMLWIDLKLIICGKGDVYEKLRKLSVDLNLSDKVLFKGYVLPEELKILTKQAFLGINLLENQGLNYYYSLGNKFFDYLHAGIPQLVVDFPEYRRFNEECQVAVIVTLEPEAIALAIRNFMQNSAFYNQLVQNCQQARLKWNWQNEEKKLLAFYQNLWETTKA
ncbi:group 1 glycosyl transferase [Adhaeribacter arboris]|uniref:Group 1 glycosyl transferase n=1 Tax=Adhaeribacter arboris TaxID=2072846 RepID=A0A2T2YCK7_9BACT|nr:glycosyltransferase [Adhaeribacter arboris]PSR53247.1 group 1 glycosyl transferase [Adhaeribacter arboris]